MARRIDGAAVDAETQVVPVEAGGEPSLRLGVETPLGLVVADRRERALVDLDDRAAGLGEGAELDVERLGQSQRQDFSPRAAGIGQPGDACTDR